MFDNNDNGDDRGQVGIGTLIVFIAMVLVAAIAAGVLINTAGFLQSSAEQTGEESQAQVTDRIDVTSSVGNVTIAGDDNVVDTVNLTVTKAPGAGDIALTEMTIHWLGPGGADTLVYNDSPEAGEFTTESIVGADDGVLAESSDQVKVIIEVDNTPSEEHLEAGDDVTLTLTTATGAERIAGLSVPETLSVYSAGDAVNL